MIIDLLKIFAIILIILIGGYIVILIAIEIYKEIIKAIKEVDMAQKRMFSLSVVDTDKFLEMPVSARLLYYELGMRADDDGFVDNWKKILLFTGLKEDDMKILIAKDFIIPFESGIIVIKHWRMNNYLQNDRVKATTHQNELKSLKLDENNVYTLYTPCIHQKMMNHKKILKIPMYTLWIQPVYTV